MRRTRLAVERASNAEARAERAVARERAIHEARARRTAVREAQLRSRPLDVLDFMVAGVTYENRADIVDSFCRDGDTVFLARDRVNLFSKNAIEVRLANGMQIGFVPEAMAKNVASLLDAGSSHSARIKKILSGARAPIPVVVAAIYRADSGRADAVFEHQVPPKVTRGSSTLVR